MEKRTKETTLVLDDLTRAGGWQIFKSNTFLRWRTNVISTNASRLLNLVLAATDQDKSEFVEIVIPGSELQSEFGIESSYQSLFFKNLTAEIMTNFYVSRQQGEEWKQEPLVNQCQFKDGNLYFRWGDICREVFLNYRELLHSDGGILYFYRDVSNFGFKYTEPVFLELWSKKDTETGVCKRWFTISEADAELYGYYDLKNNLSLPKSYKTWSIMYDKVLSKVIKDIEAQDNIEYCRIVSKKLDIESKSRKKPIRSALIEMRVLTDKVKRNQLIKDNASPIIAKRIEDNYQLDTGGLAEYEPGYMNYYYEYFNKMIEMGIETQESSKEKLATYLLEDRLGVKSRFKKTHEHPIPDSAEYSGVEKLFVDNLINIWATLDKGIKEDYWANKFQGKKVNKMFTEFAHELFRSDDLFK